MHLHKPGETIISVMEAHTAAGRHDEAARLLRIAKCNPTTQTEAQIWEGMQVLRSNPRMAYRLFNSAAIALPEKAEIQVLQARAAELAGEPELAHQLIENALYADPLSPEIRIAAWRSRAKALPPEALQRQLLKALPDITDGSELAAVLPMLPRGPIGVIAYDPVKSELHGWTIDTAATQDMVQLECMAMNQRMTLAADQASDLLRSAGLPATHGGLRLKVPAGTYRLEVRVANGAMLCGSPLVPLAPLISPPPPKGDPRKQPIDILIPVYGGEAETLACIHSVLTARKLNGVKHEIIVLEDASPEPALVAALIALAQSGAITLVRHPANLGFIRGMNRGMIMHPERDVIWLNADTLVHGNWVDRLRHAAYSATDIASVTPFSNNGELMSFPEPSTSHAMPNAEELKALDTLAAATKAPPVPLDVGNGFCLYLRRKAMATVGFLDEIHMARGYGEETDWCLRATATGFKHIGAPNVFVAHKGEVSFGAEKRGRVKQNMRIIDQRYPWAEPAYVRFTLADPVEPARQRLQAARFGTLQKAVMAGSVEPALYFSDSLATAGLRQPEPVLDGRVHLAREYKYGKWWVSLNAAISPLPVHRRYAIPKDMPQLRKDLSSLGLLAAEVPVHGTLTPALQAIIAELGVVVRPQVQAAPVPTNSSQQAKPPSAWLIGDATDSQAARAWLSIARKIAIDEPGTHLLLPYPVTASMALQSTGIVIRGDVPRRVNAAAHARACGCPAVLHQFNGLNTTAVAEMAERYGLDVSHPPLAWLPARNTTASLRQQRNLHD